jgi:tetratricopeptide (TPR) repeat protein
VGERATIEQLERANGFITEMYARNIDPQVDLRALFRGNTPSIKQMDAAEQGGGVWLLRAALRQPADGSFIDLDVRKEGDEFVFEVVPAKPLPIRGREQAPTLDQLISGDIPVVDPVIHDTSHFFLLPGDAISERMGAWDYEYSLTRQADGTVKPSWERIDAARRTMNRATVGTAVHQEYMYYLGYNYLQMGFGREARYYFSQMSARPGTIPQHDIALERARAELTCGNYDEARQWFYEAHALGGHHDSILEGLAIVSLETGNPPRAPTGRLLWATTRASGPLMLAAELLQIDQRVAESRDILEAIDRDTLTPKQKLLHALRLGDARFYDRSKDNIEQAASAWAMADPELARTRDLVVQLQQTKPGEWVPLIPSLVQASMQRSDAGAEALYLLSQIDAQIHLPEDAINDLALILSRYPSKARGSDVPERFWQLYSSHVRQLAERGRFFEIAALHESVWSPTVRRAVRAPEALVHVAEAYEQVGLPGRAVIVLRDAVQVLVDADIDDVELLYHLAELYAAVGEGVDRLPDLPPSPNDPSLDPDAVDSPFGTAQDRVWQAGLDTLSYLRRTDQDVIPTAKIDLLEARLDMGQANVEAAAKALARAKRDPEYRALASLRLALLEADQGKCVTAVPALRRLAASETGLALMQDSRPWLALARCEIAGGNVQAAGEAARKAASLAQARIDELVAQDEANRVEIPGEDTSVEIPPELTPPDRETQRDRSAPPRRGPMDFRGLTELAETQSAKLRAELRELLEAELQYAVGLASVAEGWGDAALIEQLQERGGIWSSMAADHEDEERFADQVDARTLIPWDGL